MTVKLYSLPNCIQCSATKKDFTRLGIQTEVIDMSQDQEAMDRVRTLGYSAAPVVVVSRNGEESHWSGFKPDRIKALVA